MGIEPHRVGSPLSYLQGSLRRWPVESLDLSSLPEKIIVRNTVLPANSLRITRRANRGVSVQPRMVRSSE